MNNLIINPQFIGSQQTHHKRRLHRIDHCENRGEHSIEDQHRYYLWTRRFMVDYSCIIMEATRLMYVACVIDSPSGRVEKRSPDGLAMEQRLAAAEKGFRDCLQGF